MNIMSLARPSSLLLRRILATNRTLIVRCSRASSSLQILARKTHGELGLDTTYLGNSNTSHGGDLKGEEWRIDEPTVVPTVPIHLQQSFEGQAELPRLPRSVQAVYLRPLRREAEYGVPSCDLQMRSYSVRNLEFFADFALRAAYYLKLPAFGPVPLPRITERWTVPKSNFVFKKAQENFERITMRRLIQIRDGSPETVELWLAFLKKHAYYGIGMKANIWEYNELVAGKTKDLALEDTKIGMQLFGWRKSRKTSETVVQLMNSEKFRLAAGGNTPMNRL